MSWIEKLYRTYEENTDAIGTGKTPLLPVCHTMQNAHVTIVLDGNGEFIRASVVSNKEDMPTIIPATEESAGRTSGWVAHPLCDKLAYVAGDYVKYSGEMDAGEKTLREYLQRWGNGNGKKKPDLIDQLKRYEDNPNQDSFLELLELWLKDTSAKPNGKEAQLNLVRSYLEFAGNKSPQHALYFSQLKQWTEADSANSKIKAVYDYVSKGRMIQDLVESKILYLEPDGRETLCGQWNEKVKPDIFKYVKVPQKDVVVRFAVEVPGDPQSALWLDQAVSNSWIKYYSNLRTEKGLCFVTGDRVVLADQHPAKIRNSGDKAKLISSNDTSGFTFRGRFTDSDEACGVGFTVTQKAHSALRWLIARQGRRDGDQAVVAWAVTGLDVPDPLADTFGLLFSGVETSKQKTVYTAQEVGIALSKMSAGYSAKLGATTDVIVIGLDSATPGRMAIAFYRELNSSEYLEHVLAWHSLEAGCVWLQYYGKEKIFVGAPAPRDIADCAYGRRLDEKLRKATIQRLLPCIVDGVRVPVDLVNLCVRRASNHYGKEYWEYEKTLGIACALFRHHQKERGYKMSLEPDRTTRDYLYGRLLALAENIESYALYVGGEKRETNAARWMQRFADRPFSTWRTIELKLEPYKTRLRRSDKYSGFLYKREKEMDAIMSSFSTDQHISDEALSGEFLLGYHCQRAVLLEKYKATSTDEIESESVVENDEIN